MLWAGCVVVALAGVVGMGRLWAEGKDKKTAKPAAPKTRVALINLTGVIKNYEKYKNFHKEIEATAKPFQERDKTMRARAEKLAKELQVPDLPAEKKEKIAASLKKLQRQAEDNSAKAKLTLGKKSDTQMKTLYEDVLEAGKRYAAAHDFDLVLHYNDATTQPDRSSVPNIARKLQAGALMPVYVTDGLDITQEITDLLNHSMPKE
jgi:Skp family chaperone for outer membrane proteins